MVDLNKIRDRLKSITHSDKDSSLWKPSPGSQQIRIVPYKFDEEMPFIELYFHYGIKGKSILSLKTFGESDPIAEFSERLKSSGNQDDYRMGRHFEPKLRILSKKSAFLDSPQFLFKSAKMIFLKIYLEIQNCFFKWLFWRPFVRYFTKIY